MARWGWLDCVKWTQPQVELELRLSLAINPAQLVLSNPYPDWTKSDQSLFYTKIGKREQKSLSGQRNLFSTREHGDNHWPQQKFQIATWSHYNSLKGKSEPLYQLTYTWISSIGFLSRKKMFTPKRVLTFCVCTRSNPGVPVRLILFVFKVKF